MDKLLRPHVTDETSCPQRGCNKCDCYRKQLEEYKDAEENGMLIHLPCRVGDRTYQIKRRYEVARRSCTCCTTACGSNTDCEYFNKEKEECLNLTAKDEIQIVSRGFKLEDYFDFGKTVFLTREAAEQALAKMKGV